MKHRLASFVLALTLACMPLASGEAGAQAERQWLNLNGKPLKHAFYLDVIRTVIHRFSVLPGDVADELAEMVIHARGRQSTLCKGDRLAGMSFGNSEVWDQPVLVVWQNVRENCKPVTVWETSRGIKVYGVERVHACKNLVALFPRKGSIAALPQEGPRYGMVPETECPSYGTASCC